MNGDVPDRDAAGRDDDETAWLDLVARYDAPVSAAGSAADSGVPWPEREDLAGPVQVTPAAGISLPPREPPAGQWGQPWPRLAPGSGPRDAPGSREAADDPAQDHYIPPPAPPLPRLDPVTKGAWLALFGGPLYLLIATAAGWTVSGLAAFIAVAAFVGGFIVLVLRMDGGPPRDSGPGDGAVV